MTRRQKIVWTAAAAAAVVLLLFLAVALLWNQKSSGPALPAIVRYDTLPAEFNQALQEAHQQWRAQPRDPERVRALARLYQANRLYSAAKTCYALIHSIPPGLSARDHYYLADIAQNEGNLDGALTELRAVIASDPTYLPARLSIAEALFKSGHEEDAAKAYAAVVALAPNHPMAVVGLARIAVQRGDDNTAVSLLENLLAAHPESGSAAALLAQILSRRGEAQRAEALAQWSRQKPEPAPVDPWMLALLADCYDSQVLALKAEEYFFSGRREEALSFLERVESLDPKSWLPSLLRGWSQARAHRDTEAAVDYRSALDKGGDPEKVLPLLVTSLLQLSQIQEAVAVAGEHHAKKPDSQTILLAYAEAVTRQSDESKTRTVLTKLLEKDPYLYAQNMTLAKILWTAGDRDDAAKCLERVARTFPRDVPSRALLGQFYLEKSEPLAAITPLEQALEQSAAPTPEREELIRLLSTAYSHLADAEVGQGRLVEAVALYDKMLRLNPTNLAACSGKANALVQLKQFAGAAEVLEAMAVLQPENPTIFLSLGDVLFQQGSKVQARDRWQQALRLTPPGDLELRQALDHRIQGSITVEDLR